MFFTSSVSFHLFLIPYTLSLSLSLFLPLFFAFSSGSCRGPENLATGEKFMRRQICFACPCGKQSWSPQVS